MSSAREQILGRIRAASRGNDAEARTRLAAHTPGPVPRRGQTEGAARIQAFIAEATRAEATVACVGTQGDVPGAVVDYLKGRNLALRVSAQGALKDIPWSKQPLLDVDFSPIKDGDGVGLSRALGAVAETGTLVLCSGGATPTRTNLLPDTHIVVLDAADIEGAYEDVWARLREGAGGGPLPRTVNWITGPSRTADIEQTLLLGAHGPRRLHIVVVGADA